MYAKLFSTRRLQMYASMISNMDYNIGRVLDSIEELGVANSTLIIFTSDNGPENDAGM
jgi:arylsulfatase A